MPAQSTVISPAPACNSTSGADLGKFERGLSSCHVILSANVGARALKGLDSARSRFEESLSQRLRV